MKPRLIDYHLHFWPHSEVASGLIFDQIYKYCEKAREFGIEQLAITEHTHRFKQVYDLVGQWWEDAPGSTELKMSMKKYWDHHGTYDLEDYVSFVLAVKDQGLPVVLGLEVDYMPGMMGKLSKLFANYPFDVLLGSVHWLGTWGFDVLNDDNVLLEWDSRNLDIVFRDYALKMEELIETNSCDVLAHPDIIKIANRFPADSSVVEEMEDRIVEAAAKSPMSVEISSAGLRKPISETYPSRRLLNKLVAAGVQFTTASDAHEVNYVGYKFNDIGRLIEEIGLNFLNTYNLRVAQPLQTGLETHGK